MATPTITPTPAAPAAAPVSAAPAATPTPTPTAPAAPPPAAQPAAGAPPSGGQPSGPQPPAKPSAADFGSASDHYQAMVTYQQELEAFKAENPGVEIPADAPAAPGEAPAAEGETKPAEGETQQPAEEQKPAEGENQQGTEEEPFTLQDDPALTPQALNDLFKGDEALKAAIDANPAAKGAIMKMAREHAELSQFKGIFPNADSAKFARETANRTIGLRSQFQMADTPEGMAKAFDTFMQEFAVIGADGKQVMDEQGQPVYGDDLYAFGEHVVTRYTDSTLAEVEARLAANQYPNEAARQRDEDMKIALSIIKEDLSPSDAKPADPDLSGLTPDVRAQVEARLNEAKRIEQENAAKAAGANKQNREQIRTQGNTQFFQQAAGRMWPQVDKIIDKLRSAGAVIPDWQLNTTLPGTNTSAFKNEVGKRIEQFVKADPYVANHMMQLELQYIANPTPETMAQRVQYFDSVLQQRDATGRSLLNRVVSQIVHGFGASTAAAAQATQQPTAPAASREPRQGGPQRPQNLTAEQAWKNAEQQLAKEVNGWDNMTQAERMAQTMTRRNQLLTAAR